MTYIVLFVAFVVAGCNSTSTVGGTEISRRDKGSRVGVTNTGEGAEIYGSVRMGGSFR